jgi:hypothetical protein
VTGAYFENDDNILLPNEQTTIILSSTTPDAINQVSVNGILTEVQLNSSGDASFMYQAPSILGENEITIDGYNYLDANGNLVFVPSAIKIPFTVSDLEKDVIGSPVEIIDNIIFANAGVTGL